MPNLTENHDPDGGQLKGKTGLRRIANAFSYSIDGISAAWRHEDAFRTEVALAAVLLPVAMLVPVASGGVGRAVMAGAVLLVLVAELLNSSIEAVVDRQSLESHPLAKRAKDCASAAVLLSLVNVAVMWALVLLG